MYGTNTCIYIRDLYKMLKRKKCLNTIEDTYGEVEWGRFVGVFAGVAHLVCVAVCCCALQCVAVWCTVVQCGAVSSSVLRCVAVCCSMLQCAAVCCIVLQCVTVRCNLL